MKNLEKLRERNSLHSNISEKSGALNDCFLCEYLFGEAKIA